MSAIDDILTALKTAAQAGAASASAGGKDLTQDVETFIVPHLKDIATQVASIVAKRLDGTYTDVTAKALIGSEEDALETLVETMVSLTALQAQTIVNSVVASLYKSVNTAVGFALLV
jgi:hypothetical protein